MNRKLIEEETKPANAGWLLKLAATVLLIAVSSILIYRSAQPSLSDLLSDALAEPYEISVALRNSETASNMDNAAVYYNQGNYTEVVKLLENEKSSRAIFYRGLSLLYAGEYVQATDELQKNELQTSRFAEQAKWYLALGFLKSAEEKKARKILEEIVTIDHHYKRDSSKKLLEKL